MGVTGANAEVVYLTDSESIEPDYDHPVSNEQLVAALEERTRRLEPGERQEVDLVGHDEIGI